MASSAQIFEYVTDDYVADNYAISIHVLVVELVSQDSEVVGTAAVKRGASGALVSGDASVSSTSERQINIVNGDLTAEEVGVVTVAGDGERSVITEVAAIDQSSPCRVVATGAVKRDAVGVVEAQTSTIVGLSERQIDAVGTVVASASTTVGTSERTITSSSIDLTADTSAVVGAGGRKVSGTGTLVDDSSAVVGGF